MTSTGAHNKKKQNFFPVSSKKDLDYLVLTNVWRRALLNTKKNVIELHVDCGKHAIFKGKTFFFFYRIIPTLLFQVGWYCKNVTGLLSGENLSAILDWG